MLQKKTKKMFSDVPSFKGQLVEAGTVGDNVVELARRVNINGKVVSAITTYRQISPERNRGMVTIVIYT